VTRINCIPPAELSRQHLVAEYRELPRIYALVRQAIARGELPDDRRNPTEYTLGRGHIRFFYSRLGYLTNRQRSLVAEMQRRGYQPTFVEVDQLAEGIPAEWCRNWEPTEAAVALNRARIAERSTAARLPLDTAP